MDQKVIKVLCPECEEVHHLNEPKEDELLPHGEVEALKTIQGDDEVIFARIFHKGEDKYLYSCPFCGNDKAYEI